MKKMMRIFMTGLLVFLVTSNCFAATRMENTVSPQYVATDQYRSNMIIDNGGTLTMSGVLHPKNATSIDKVEVSFVLRDSSGTIKYNQKHTATWNNQLKRYEVFKTYSLRKKGIYILQSRYDVYKNGSLVETIYANQITKSY